MSRVLAAALLGALALVPASGAERRKAPSPATLLARHVPILVLHPSEQIPPVAVDGFLADSDLQRRTPAGWETVVGSTAASGGELRLDQRFCRSVEGAAATPCYAQAQAAHGTDPVAYGAAFRRGNRIALQYWFWYPWDAFSPTDPAGDLWQVHEGDWESVSVILDRTGNPLVVGLSSHCEGTRRPWARAPKRGPRPLVFVALGSHANFFRAGEHRLDPRCPGHPELIKVIEAFDAQPVDRTGRGRTLRPRLLRVTATAPEWMSFGGYWGEDAYVHFPGNPPVLYGLGPLGPAYHEQWRLPVADVLSWPVG